MNTALKIRELSKQFKQSKTLRTADIDTFYRTTEPDISKSTVNWRIYSLVRQGVIQRTGNGAYCLGEIRHFLPQVNQNFRPNEFLHNKKDYLCVYKSQNKLISKI